MHATIGSTTQCYRSVYLRTARRRPRCVYRVMVVVWAPALTPAVYTTRYMSEGVVAERMHWHSGREKGAGASALDLAGKSKADRLYHLLR